MTAVPGVAPPRARTKLRVQPLAILLSGIAAVAVTGAVRAVGGGTPAAATTTSRTVAVTSGVVQQSVSGSGNLAPTKTSDQSFDTAGEITKVYVAEGDHVTKGEALVRLQPTDTTADVEWLRAPFSGTVASLGVQTGDQVQAGSTTAAVELVALAHYDLAVSLSESDIGKVKVGQPATVTVSATGEELSARVTNVGVVSAASSSSASTTAATSSSSGAVAYPVTLRLTQSSSGLKPGMTATADIVTAQSSGLIVPTQALRGNSVTLANGTTQRVTTGIAGDSTTQIVSGLSAGDQVLVTSRSATASTSTSTTTQRSQQTQGFTGGPPAGAGAGAGGGPGGSFGG